MKESTKTSRYQQGRADRRETPKSRRMLADSVMRPLLAAHMAYTNKVTRRLTGRPRIAWVTSGAPVELLRAAGVTPLYPENYGALVSAWGKAGPLLEAAEAHGYPEDLCSYARIHIGSLLAPQEAPLGGLPRPDLLVGANNICATVTKWWEALAEFLEVPLFWLDIPFRERLGGGAGAHRLAYVEAQLRELERWLQGHGAAPYERPKIKRVLSLSRSALELWRRCLETCKASPSPMNSADRFVYMSPIVNLRGTVSAVAFYAFLLAEATARMWRGQGAVPGERYRLLWDNIAVWPATFKLPKIFAAHGCSFPVDTYTSAWSGEFSPDEGLAGVARVYADIFLNLDVEDKVQRMVEMARQYRLHGAVFHSNRSCKPYSLGQIEVKRRFTHRTGLPVLMLEADMADPRHVDLGSMREEVATFAALLQERRPSL